MAEAEEKKILLITNEKRGVKSGESDIDFWGDLLDVDEGIDWVDELKRLEKIRVENLRKND